MAFHPRQLLSYLHPGRRKHPSRRRLIFSSKRRPGSAIEHLENRILLAVGADFLPPPVPPPSDFDGVIQLTLPGGGLCSGSLLADGRHVLTAAHCVDAGANPDGVVDPGDYTITFETAKGPHTFTVDQSRISLHPGWVDNPGIQNGNDLAIIELADAGRQIIAPGGKTNGYELYRENNEIGQVYNLVGFGEAGNDGDTGATLPGGTRRQSSNVFESDGSRLLREVQSIEVDATGGAFTLTFGGDTTGNIDFNASPAEVAAALNALDSVNTDGFVEVFGNAGLWFVNFVDFADPNVDALTINSGGLAGLNIADVDTEIEGNAFGLPGTNALLSDFDNGEEANDALGQVYGLTDRGLGDQIESLSAPGDSGAPFFLGDNLIAGVVSGGLGGLGQNTSTPVDVDPNVFATFGEIDIVTRVSQYQAFIDAEIDDDSIDLVLDMNLQDQGNDSIEDRILARIVDGELQLLINDAIVYTDMASQINSLRIVGSTDDDMITVEGPPFGFDVLIDAGSASHVDTMVAELTQQDNDIQVELDGGDITVDVNGQQLFRIINTDDDDSLVINGRGGNDTLTVDSTNGLVDVGQGVRFNGGDGFDRLNLSQTGGPNRTRSAINIGASPGSGQSVIATNGAVQTVYFEGIEPVTDNVAADTFDITSVPNIASLLQDDNQINYEQGAPDLLGPNAGRVTVDDFEPIEFLNKTTLVIDAGAGSDQINLNNPNTPTGLTSITVNGGDPTGSDTVIVNGRANVADTITYNPTGSDSGNVAIVGLPTVNFTTAEHLQIDGQNDNAGGPGDILEISTVNIDGNFVLTPGAEFDAGHVDFRDGGSNLATAAPLDFDRLGEGGSLSFTNSGRNDNLIYRGTDLDDTFSVDAAGTVLLNTQIPVLTRSINNLTLAGLDGDDMFNVVGNHNLPAIIVEGGNPSASDDLNFTGAGGDITIDIGAQTITEAGFGPVSFSGVERANINADPIQGGANVTVVGTPSDDDIAYTPNGADSGQVVVADVNTVFQIDAIGDLTIDGGGGDDALRVNGDSADNTIHVSPTAIAFAVAPLQDVNTIADVEELSVFGENGSDVFNVTPGAIPIFIDGGDPIGIVGDTLSISAGAGPVMFNPGSENDEGGFDIGANATISFDHIEAASVSGTDFAATVMGTGDDDEITAVGIATNRVEVQVNDGPIVAYIGVVDLTLLGKNGDDDITLDINIDDLGVTINVDGGPNRFGPTAGPTGDGDTLRVTGVPAFNDDPIWIPDGVDSGTLDLFGQAMINVTTVERLIYDGESEGDFVMVAGDGTGADADDDFRHQPGEAVDSGFVGVRSGDSELLGLHYENIGDDGDITINGQGGVNSLALLGTGDSDQIGIAFPAADSIDFDLASAIGLHIDVLSTQVQNYTVDSLEGDDVVNLFAPLQYTGSLAISAGGPGNSDVLNVFGAPGTEEVFDITPFFPKGDGEVSIDAVPARYRGIEHITIFGNDPVDMDNLVVNDDGGDNEWVVSAGPEGGDRIQIDDRESIDYVSMTNVTLNNTFGTDHFQVHPTNLLNFSGDFRVNGDSLLPIDDVLQIVGTPGADIITSGATTITTNGVTITAGDNLVEVDINSLQGDDSITLTGFTLPTVIDAGAGDDMVDLDALTADSTVFGGDGDDLIDGEGVTSSTVRLTLHGNEGNDNLIGAEQGGANAGDQLFGGPGDDRLDGGTGQDQFFGEDGSDLLVWVAGDGTDLMEGGDGQDEMQFIASDGANRLEVFGGGLFDASGITLAADTFPPGTTLDPARIIFALNSTAQNAAAVFLNMADVETIDIDALGGADLIAINNQVDATFFGSSDIIQQGTDLTHTTLRGVDIDVGSGDGDADQVDIHGRLVDDEIDVTLEAGTVDLAGLSFSVRIAGSATDDRLAAHGQDGDDDIKAANGVETAIGITLSGNAGNDFLSADAILNGGAGNDLLIGGAGDDMINGNAGDDVIDGRGGANTIDGGAGEDIILVSGTAAADTITTTHLGTMFNITGGLSAGMNTIANMEQVRIEALGGADFIAPTLDPDGGLNYEVRGGDPIGVGDALNITSPGNVTYMPGPENDSGIFQAATTTPTNISFDEFEGLMVALAAPANAVTVMGTGDDDEITAVGGPAPNQVTVQVNDSPAVFYTGVATITLQGKNGHDNITIDEQIAALAVTFNVDGGLPESGSDSLRVIGVLGVDDMPTWTPSAAEAGVLTLAGQMPINVTAIENLFYDGENDNEMLTVNGTDDADVFVHTPGAAFDSGRVDITSNNVTYLGINYEELGAGGSVNVNGMAQPADTADALNVVGTNQNDILNVVAMTGAVQHTLSNGLARVPILQTNLETLVLDALAGDDVTTINEPQPYTTINVNGGDPDSGSDVLNLLGDLDDAVMEDVTISPNTANSTSQTVRGLGAVINVTGTELIGYTGDNANDMLTVDPGAGDDWVRVQSGTPRIPAMGEEPPQRTTDLVTSNSLPNIEFKAIDTFQVDANASGGSDVVTIVTRALSGAAPENYQLLGGRFDSLVIEGADGPDDDYIVTNPPGDPDPVVRVVDNISQRMGVTVTAIGPIQRVQINTLAGDDTVTVDVDDHDDDMMTPSDVIGAPIIFDGGASSDSLIVTGDPTTDVDEVIYSPGPDVTEGRLAYENTADQRLMTIDFVNLEPVLDLVVANTLTVSGTNADNAIDYRPGVMDAMNNGLVSVDEFETIEFSNKTTLILDGLAGSDGINLNNPNTPTGLTQINVEGGNPTASDRLIVGGTAAMDIIDFTPTADDAGTVEGAQPVPVEFTEIEHLVINGLGDDDTLDVNTPSDTDSTVVLTPGGTIDAGDVQVDSLVPMSFTNLGAAGALRLSDPGGTETSGDTLIYRGTDASDVFDVPDDIVAAPSIGLNDQIGVDTIEIENYTLQGLGGNDRFNITPQQNIAIAVQGDEPNGTDSLFYRRSVSEGAAAAVTIDLDAGNDDPTSADFEPDFVQAISQGGVGDVTHSGVEITHVDANDADVTVIGTRLDDVITFTPGGPATGRLVAEGIPTIYSLLRIPDTRTLTITGGMTNVAGADSGFADKVVYVGTNGSDLIRVDSSTRIVDLDIQGFGFPPTAIATWRSVTLESGQDGRIEVVEAQGLGGNDTFHVEPGENVGNGLFIEIDGGSPLASDALVIANIDNGSLTPLGAGDFVVVGKSRIPDAGNIIVFQSAVRRPNIAYQNVEVVSPSLGASGGDRLLILGPDNFEENNFQANSAFLGAGETINVQDLAIFPNAVEHVGVPADVDYFRVVAEKTGTLDFQVYFTAYDANLLPGGGDLDIEVLDAAGNVIAGDGTFGDNNEGNGGPNSNNERVRIPAVAGQSYFLRVFGRPPEGESANLVVNGYDITIINEAPPVPYDIELNDILQVAVVNNSQPISATSFAADLTPVNAILPAPTFDFVGKSVEYTSGANIGRRAVITVFNSATGVFTVGPGLLAAPAVGDSFLVETTDTGRSQFDDVLRDNTPIIVFRLDDDILLNDLPGNPSPDTPPDEVIPIPFNPSQAEAPASPAGFRVPVFIEGNPQQPGTFPQTPIGYARPVPMTPGVYTFDFGTDAINSPLALTDGGHFISAKVEIIDPAIGPPANLFGYGQRSQSLEIVVDAAAPTVYFGDPATPGGMNTQRDGLHADSDSGVEGIPATFSDNITNDTTPTFYGRAEANSIVRLYLDADANGLVDTTDILLGQTVALPEDGTNQEPFGQWEITSDIDFNDPAAFPTGLPFDGSRTVLVTAEDQAGNESSAAGPDGMLGTSDDAALTIFIDTQGPQISAAPFIAPPTGPIVPVNGSDGQPFNLFGVKGDNGTQGPTPPILRLAIPISDLPDRVADFLYNALAENPAGGEPNNNVQNPAENPGHYMLVGDSSGVIDIADVKFFPDAPTAGDPATGNIVLTFNEPLPDDRFTLTVKDEIVDPAGNQLDGESNAIEPNPSPDFPSGDKQPGGDFVARFTVDTRAEIGVWGAGSVWVDTNGNFVFDTDNTDAANRDIVYTQGFTSDAVFAGNFVQASTATADGFDKLAAYGFFAGATRFLIDLDHDGAPDINRVQPGNIQGLPVAANFDGNPANGDEVGLFESALNRWHLDTDHNFIVDTILPGRSMKGLPFAGDLDGDGQGDLGTWTDDVFRVDLSSVGGLNGNPDFTFRFGFPGVREQPAAGDINGDGLDDIGLFVADRPGVTVREAAEWYFLASIPDPDNPGQFLPVTSRIGDSMSDVIGGVPNIEFQPLPFGPDIYAKFGDDFAAPVVGNFDPPVGLLAAPQPQLDFHNELNPFDINGDMIVNNRDALLMISELRQSGASQLPENPNVGEVLGFWDVNNDNILNNRDILEVRSYLRSLAQHSPADNQDDDPLDAILDQIAEEIAQRIV